MKISIVTPSFRNSQWLKLCIPSVADQEGVEFEHIVQDAESDDGTLDWLPHDPRVTAHVEKDAGMYDAVNRGWRRSSGEIVAYINCDEQYLPGALKTVHDYFEAHPEIDVLVADAVVVDADGNYICHRVGLKPLRHAIWVRFNVLTCSLFIRRRVLEKHGHYFDTRWRDLGDAFWLTEATRLGLRFGELHFLASVFTETGDNMNLKPNAQREAAQRHRMVPRWIKLLTPLFSWHHRFRVAACKATWRAPFEYDIYTRSSLEKRVTKRAEHPTPRWIGRS